MDNWGYSPTYMGLSITALKQLVLFGAFHSLKDHYDLEGLKILELGCGLPFLSAALVALGAQVCRGFLLVEGKGAMKFSGTKVILYGCLVGSESECMYIYIYVYYRIYDGYGISYS